MEHKETIIYGGSFNPPTNAHRTITAACRDYNPQADIWLMPSGERYDKNITMPIHHRIGMLQAMIDSLDNRQNIEVCTLEIMSPHITETYTTVQQLTSQHLDRQFRYVFGSDSFAAMRQWSNGEILQTTLPMLLVSRLGSRAIEQTNNTDVLPVQTPDISSTLARASLLKDAAIDDLVCCGISKNINYMLARALADQRIIIVCERY